MNITHLHRTTLLTPFYLVAALILFIPLGTGIGSISHYDGFIHVGLFAILGLVTFFTYSKHIRIAGWSLVIFATYSEIVQSFIPSRTTDIRDLFNDCIGIAIALFIFAILHKEKTKEVVTPPLKKKPASIVKKRNTTRNNKTYPRSK